MKTHYGWTNFHQTKWCIMSIIIGNKVRFLWHYLTILIISKKKKNVHDNIWKPKVHFDLIVRWRGLDKINVHKIYNIHFFNDHKVSCLWFMNITIKKIEKIMLCPLIKFPSLWYDIFFFFNLILLFNVPKKIWKDFQQNF